MVSLVCSHFGSIGGVKDDGTSGLIFACCGAYECTRNKNIPKYIYINLTRTQACKQMDCMFGYEMTHEGLPQRPKLFIGYILFAQ